MNRSHMRGLVLLFTSITCGVAWAVPNAKEPKASKDVSPDDFVAWVREGAIPIERWKINPSVESYLDQALSGRRIVFLGEPGHFFREKYDIQLMLIESLAKRGYRHLFIEGLGATASSIVNDYVSSVVPFTVPDESPSDLERYRGRVLGQAVTTETSEFQQRLAGAQRRFFEALRRMNHDGAEPLTVHPLDIDMAPGGCRLTIDSLLSHYKSVPHVAQLRRRCARQPDEPVQEWFERVEKVRKDVDADPNAALDGISKPDRHRLYQCIDCLVESLAFTLTRQADGNMDRALVRREPAMFRQVKAALDRLPRDAKVIMMAHCNHLSRVGADTMRARRPSVGEMIAKEYPDEVYSIWMLYDHGWLLNPMAPTPLEELPSDPERIESLMARAGSTYLLPLHTGSNAERYLSQKRRMSYFSWYETVTLRKQTDALFFVDEITALQAYQPRDNRPIGS